MTDNRTTELREKLTERGVLSDEWYVSRDRYDDDIAELKADVKKWADAANEQRLVAMEQADKVQELTAERDELRDIIAHMPKTEQECEACQDAHDRLMFNSGVDIGKLRDKVDSLTAQRDAARQHEEELLGYLIEKQRTVEIQRDSFLKMEAENAELRQMLADVSKAI